MVPECSYTAMNWGVNTVALLHLCKRPPPSTLLFPPRFQINSFITETVSMIAQAESTKV